MVIPSAHDFSSKSFRFFDVEVTSDVLSVEPIKEIKEDAICIRVKNSCESASWGTRTTVNSMTIYLTGAVLDIVGQVERTRPRFAEELAKAERKISPARPAHLLVKVSNCDGTKSIDCIAAVDVGTSPTRLQADMIPSLQLEKSDRFFLERLASGQLQQMRLYSGKITFGIHSFDVDMLPTKMNLPCVIGGQFIQRAVGENYGLDRKSVV